MKLIYTFLLLLIMLANPFRSHAQQPNLDGVWKPVKLEMGGKNLPETTFSNQSLTLKDSTYVFVAESVDKGIARYNGHNMDIYGKDGVNKGHHITALYKFENGELTICYNLKGDSYPTSFKTDGNPMLFTAVFKRVGK